MINILYKFRLKTSHMCLWICTVCLFAGCTILSPSEIKKPASVQTVKRSITESVKRPEIGYYLMSEFSKHDGDIDKASSYMEKAISADPASEFLQKESAKLSILKNDIPKASAIIETGLKKNPDSIEFIGLLAQIKLFQKKDDEVPPLFEKIIKLKPDDQSFYYLLGSLYTKMNNIPKASETFKRLVIKFPDSYSGHYYLGRIYIVEEKYDKAASELQEAYRLNSDLVDALYSLVQIYEIQNKQAKLVETYQKILDKEPDDIRASMALAVSCHKMKKNEQAVKILSDLGVKSDTNPDILKLVVRYYIKKALYHDAIFIMDELMKHASQKGDYYYFIGACQNELKNISTAMAMFEKVPPSSKFYEKAVITRAFHFVDTGHNVKAIEILEAALKNIPDNTEFMLYLGSFYEEEEIYQKAVALYLKGLSIDRNSTKLYFRLGVVYDKKGDRSGCIKEMKNVIRLDPEDANALNYLGYTYADLGINLEEAEDLIKRAMKFKPDDGYITDSLGWVYFKKGFYDKAIATLEKAVKLIPDDPTLLEHFGDALQKTSEHDKALEYYKRSLKNKKKDTEGLEIKIERLINKQATLKK